MSDLLLKAGENLNSVELMADAIVQGRFDIDQITPRIIELAARGETSEEVLSIARAFRGVAIQVETAYPVVADLCGTGGAKFRTFNVSTTASFVLAASGIPVAKHGNRSQNGSCGSADVIESLGAPLLKKPKEAGIVLDSLGFSFLFAPSFHPAMRNAMPIRRRLNQRTVFNIIGPLLNPVAASRRQLMGVHHPRLLDILPPVLDALGIEDAMLVHGYPGMDEVSTLGPTEVVKVRDGSVERFQIDPKEHGISIPDPRSLQELPPSQAAIALRSVLGGTEGALRDIVTLNSACAMVAFGRVAEVEAGMRLAEETIDSGAALHKLDQFLSFSRKVIKSEIS